MAVIRFDANVTVEVALKFDGGKQVKSRIENAPDQMMYTVCGDDTIYVPLAVAEQITALGIKKMELIAITKRVSNNVTRWEVKRAGNTATQAVVPAQALSAPAPAQAVVQQTTPNNLPQPIITHTRISLLMASALCSAFDACRECERYAAKHGTEMEFTTEDVRAISNTIFIALSKDPGFMNPQPQKVNGGTNTWPQQ